MWHMEWGDKCESSLSPVKSSTLNHVFTVRHVHINPWATSLVWRIEQIVLPSGNGEFVPPQPVNWETWVLFVNRLVCGQFTSGASMLPSLILPNTGMRNFRKIGTQNSLYGWWLGTCLDQISFDYRVEEEKNSMTYKWIMQWRMDLAPRALLNVEEQKETTSIPYRDYLII